MKKFTRNDLASTEVFNNVKAYLGEHLPEYELLFVVRFSDYPKDDYLYMVAGRLSNTTYYAVWTCWNERCQTLNHGHYMLESEEKCMEIMREFYREEPPKHTYAVEVVEIYKRTVIIEAENYEEAFQEVEDEALFGEITLDYDDFYEREVNRTAKYGEQPVPPEDDTSNYWYLEVPNEN